MSEYWIAKYRDGHSQSYPWDAVVSFVLRHAPRDRPREAVRILEVGCGTGANLWFAAREGFDVSGLELSEDAISAARQRFHDDGLNADLNVGSFESLPFSDGSFDLVIDRAALTCADRLGIERAISEIARVTRAGGRFFMNVYADGHSSAFSHGAGGSGTVLEPDLGSLAGQGRITFLSKADIRELLDTSWHIEAMQRVELDDQMRPDDGMHTEWRVVALRGGTD